MTSGYDDIPFFDEDPQLGAKPAAPAKAPEKAAEAPKAEAAPAAATTEAKPAEAAPAAPAAPAAEAKPAEAAPAGEAKK